MVLAINQPYFLPYIGYWQLIHAADVFLVADNYNFIRQGWINRNRMLINGEPSLFRISLQRASQNRYISDHTIIETDFADLRRKLKFAYSRAPYYDEAMAVIEEILSCEDRNLAAFLTNSIKVVCRYLGITTKILCTSDFPHNEDYKAEYRIYDLCHRLGADTYINAIGGTELYDFDAFKQENLTLGFIRTNGVTYPQFGNAFVANLSILDLMMFNSREELRAMMDEYTILREEDFSLKDA